MKAVLKIGLCSLVACARVPSDRSKRALLRVEFARLSDVPVRGSAVRVLPRERPVAIEGELLSVDGPVMTVLTPTGLRRVRWDEAQEVRVLDAAQPTDNRQRPDMSVRILRPEHLSSYARFPVGLGRLGLRAEDVIRPAPIPPRRAEAAPRETVTSTRTSTSVATSTSAPASTETSSSSRSAAPFVRQPMPRQGPDGP
ncbi:MAG: hypothetical protein AAGD10_18365 [Myxococcota bacterium]